jgi:hypothetical protein
VTGFKPPPNGPQGEAGGSTELPFPAARAGARAGRGFLGGNDAHPINNAAATTTRNPSQAKPSQAGLSPGLPRRTRPEKAELPRARCVRGDPATRVVVCCRLVNAGAGEHSTVRVAWPWARSWFVVTTTRRRLLANADAARQTVARSCGGCNYCYRTKTLPPQQKSDGAYDLLPKSKPDDRAHTPGLSRATLV